MCVCVCVHVCVCACVCVCVVCVCVCIPLTGIRGRKKWTHRSRKTLNSDFVGGFIIVLCFTHVGGRKLRQPFKNPKSANQTF